jgi:hypothetical protein
MDLNKIIRSGRQNKSDEPGLYELINYYEKLQDIEGDTTDEEKEIIAKFIKAFDKKQGHYVNFIIDLDDSIDQIKAGEVEFYQKKLKDAKERVVSIEKLRNKLSELLIKAMDSQGLPFVETARGKATVKRNPYKLITNLGKINYTDLDFRFYELINEPYLKPKNDEIKAFLVAQRNKKDPVIIEGFHLEQTRKLHIK